MANDNVIFSDKPLNAEQERTLAALLDLLIPPSDDGRMPGAGEMDFIGYLLQEADDLIPGFVQELHMLGEASRDRQGREFAELVTQDKNNLLDELRAGRSMPLQNHMLACYYTDDAVMQALGLEPRPPYPQGHQVEPGDLSLLEPVRQRGKLYRE